jgi:hypothetical protein
VASARRFAKGAGILAAVVAIALVAIPAALAAFGARTQNEGDIITAAADYTPPAISAKVVAKSLGGVTGFVHKGGGYYVYANVATDTGNPASGNSTVKANAAEFTTGQSEAALTAGTYTAGGVTYNYRSAELTATATTEGSKPYTVTATDVAGNKNTVSGTATIDNVVPTAADIQTTNKSGGTNGLAEEGDTIVYTFSEPIDPQSILAGWTGASTPVVVRLMDNGVLGVSTGNDEVIVYNAANNAQLPLGAINMGRSDYVAGLLGGYVSYGVATPASTMVMSGNTITITLGGYTGVLVGRGTAAAGASMVWTPVATPYDRAGNAMSTTPVTQSGAVRKNF